MNNNAIPDNKHNQWKRETVKSKLLIYFLKGIHCRMRKDTSGFYMAWHV